MSPTVSPTDSRAYRWIEKISMSMNPNTVVSPYLVMGGTDACNYEPICDNIYRFGPFRADMSLMMLCHGTNERIPVSCMEDGLRFFVNFIRETSAE